MGYQKYGPETSIEERAHRRMQIIYARKIREKQTFMDDLRQYRKQKDRQLFKSIKKEVGPKWYQALSVPQREALDSLEFGIYQDLLEGRPTRTARVMKMLGIIPRPLTNDLMHCAYMGRRDPKEMLAYLFLNNYGHTIDGKKFSYDLNARLLLSAILYLGLNNLIALLTERFRPDVKEEPKIVKHKPKEREVLESPYLQEMKAVLYVRPERKRRRPAPLPNLDDLNDPFEDEPPLPRPPALPPPPPPPAKKLPRSYCDKLAEFTRIEPHSSITAMTMKTITQTSHRKLRGSKMSLTEVKKTYGISMSANKKGRRKKPVAPSTGMWNSQYTIAGVSYIHGKAAYILNTVSLLPPVGYLIHGGYKFLNGEYINIHCGFAAKPPPPKPDPCDCMKRWNNSVLEYVKNTKCVCSHHYDYGNEGTFPSENLPFFQKPTRHTPFKFNYETIFNLNDNELFVGKEFKKIWETESMLHVTDGTVVDKKDKKKKKTAKKSSTTCLGKNPKPEDYLKCALFHMRRLNIAARLPDVHLVPELREWMRERIYGPYTQTQKDQKIRMSGIYWQLLDALAAKGFGHVSPKNDPLYAGHTTWSFKQELNEKFRGYVRRYRLALFRAQANLSNLMWATTYQAAFPDKKFREIYFSYLYARMEDIMLMHPYNRTEVIERKHIMINNRYCCPPSGTEPEE